MNMQTEIIKRNNSSSYEVDLIEVREGKAVTSSLVVEYRRTYAGYTFR